MINTHQVEAKLGILVDKETNQRIHPSRLPVQGETSMSGLLFLYDHGKEEKGLHLTYLFLLFSFLLPLPPLNT